RRAKWPRGKCPNGSDILFAVWEVLVNLVGNSFQNHPLGYTSEIECSEIKKNFHNVRSRNCDCSPFKRSAQFRFVYVTLECKCWLAHELRFSTVANRRITGQSALQPGSREPLDWRG